MAVSCEIEEEPTPIVVPSVIEGHLFKSCEQNEVYANLDLYFYEVHEVTLVGKNTKYLGSTRTNDAGFYRFDVGSCSFDKDIEVKNENDELLFVTRCAGNKGFNNVDRASGIPTSMNPIKLFIGDSSFSMQDTLYMGFVTNSSIVEEVGPFQDGQVIASGKIVIPSAPVGLISVPIGLQTTSFAYWGIGKDNFECARFFSGCRNDTNFINRIQKDCQMGDTIYLDLSLARNWAAL